MNRIDKMRGLLGTLNPLSLEIIDESHKHAGHAGSRDGAGHYFLQIVTNQFMGKGTLARHRMIYSALGEMMTCEIHALNIQAHTPNEV